MDGASKRCESWMERVDGAIDGWSVPSQVKPNPIKIGRGEGGITGEVVILDS